MYYAQASAEASTFDTSGFSASTKREMSSLYSVGLEEAEADELNNILYEMSNIYGTYRACRTNPNTGVNECLYLEPELTELMARNDNYNDKLWAWRNWHNGVGRQLRPLYLRYVALKNKQARLNNYADYGDQWRQKYETTEMEKIVQDLYDQVEPLYKQLHAYIRRKLYNAYPNKIDLRGPLPAHLLGDMWGRFWVNMNEIAMPYPEKPSTDPTPEMTRQNYTSEMMFRKGNEFYTSMGLKAVPDTFWNLSMLEKPTDGREVVCHATAWDFYDAKDFRIRMCARPVFEDFQTVHHELGHIQYFMVGLFLSIPNSELSIFVFFLSAIRRPAAQFQRGSQRRVPRGRGRAHVDELLHHQAPQHHRPPERARRCRRGHEFPPLPGAQHHLHFTVPPGAGSVPLENVPRRV